MTKQTRLSKYWSGFRHSAEYQDCSDYPADMIKEGIEGGLHAIPTSVSKWDLPDLTDFLVGIRDLAFNDKSAGNDETFQAIYTIVTAFWRYLAREKMIKASSTALEAYLKDFEAQPAQSFDEPSDDDWAAGINDDPELPIWQERTSLDIANYTKDWLTAYNHSSAWRQRPTGVTEALLTAVFNELVERGYDYYRKTPKSWNKRVLTAILRSTLVTEYDFTAAEYKLIVPMLKAFLTFVADQGWLNSKRATDYQRYLQAGEAEMLANAKNGALQPNTLSLINQKMTAAGIDPEDPDAVDKFMAHVENSGELDQLYEQLFGDDDEPFDDRDDETGLSKIKTLPANRDPFADTASAAKSQKGPGKVISMKQARELLKNKKRR
ncbi:hypothetical protein RA086_00220 [Lactiplantibacillus sp. WILCCON 0030]|uniref:Uncharacterized protein n=1 Tax=Lactiplantibacillus brownii TaxID=3069269 RepID=A0ABU1A4Z4_9LACO|nr:hypothetical protein [Lactiplantibacillus brownii]MDQ7936073.1 hypothetical protein [Lactiplantibacillus brownii]